MNSDFTRDDFLGGQLTLTQPKHGYRAGVDPVMLAAAVPARPGESVLDLGCGVGSAALCLGRRVPGVELTGLELQPDYADLAQTNAAANGLEMNVITGDVRAMPEALKSRIFDHVITNPPYFEDGARVPAEDGGRETALSALDLSDWYEAALRRVAPGGYLTVIQIPERLPELLATLSGRASLEIRPLAPRAGRDAHRVIVIARKGGRSPMRLTAPTVLHAGDTHAFDGEDYTETVRAVLRSGAAWPWDTR